MRLTNEELAIVRDGNNIVLGRSGTGKTNCIVENMSRTFYKHVMRGDPPPRQEFMARSRALCNQVKRLFVKSVAASGVPHNASFLTIDEEVTALEAIAVRRALPAAAGTAEAVASTTAIDLAQTKWQPRLQTRFVEFEVLLRSGVLKPKRSPGVGPRDAESLDPIDVWKQIRSVIKGGPLVAWNNGGTRTPGFPHTLRVHGTSRNSVSAAFKNAQAYVWGIRSQPTPLCPARSLG